MLPELLTSLDDQYTAELLSKEEELDFVTTRLREEKKFLKLIESEEGSDSDSFSPRRVDSPAVDRAAESRSVIEELNGKKEALEEKLSILRVNCENIKAAIREYRVLMSKLKDAEEEAAEVAATAALSEASESAEAVTLPYVSEVPESSVSSEVAASEEFVVMPETSVSQVPDSADMVELSDQQVAETSEISAISEAASVASSDEMAEISESSTSGEESAAVAPDSHMDFYSVKTDILFRLNTIAGYILSDPLRAKIELEEIRRLLA